MKFFFLAPFRTGLNLKTTWAITDPDSLHQGLASSCSIVNRHSPEHFQWSPAFEFSEDQELHYAELADDNIPQASRPLLHLALGEKKVGQILDETNPGIENSKITVVRSYADYYDNTVALLFLIVNIDGLIDEEKFFSSLDKWSTQFCQSIVASLKTSEMAIIDKLLQGKEKRLFLKADSFLVFFDRTTQKSSDRDGAQDLLWATRVLLLDGLDYHAPILNQWVQNSIAEENLTHIGRSHYGFFTGNSIAFSKMTEGECAAFYSAIAVSMYYYVLYDIFNKNMKKLFVDISTSQKIKDQDLYKINRSQSYIDVIDNEFNDTKIGIQGMTRSFFEQFLKVWRYPELTDSVNKKKASVNRSVNYLLQEKRSRYNKIVESILASIGVFAVLDFIINLFSFKKNGLVESDQYYGLTHLVDHVPIDMAMNFVLVLIIVILFLIHKRE